MAPIGEWVFFATAIDADSGNHYGFRYYINSNKAMVYHFGTLNANHYTLNYSTTNFNLGGVANPNYIPPGRMNGTFANCYCYTQYFRMFLDYAPSASEAMLNLGLMDPSSII